MSRKETIDVPPQSYQQKRHMLDKKDSLDFRETQYRMDKIHKKHSH